MENNRVGINQLALLYLLAIAGGKFLTLPSILANDVGHDSWLVLAFGFLWDAICLTFLLWAIKLNKDSKFDLSAVLNKTVTKAVCKIVMALFFVIFIIRANILIASCYKMFAVTFDVSTNLIVFVAPVAALSFFAVKLGFNAVARTGQLLFGIVFISVLFLILSPVSQISLTSLLPVGEAGWGNIVKTSFERSFWFSDYLFFYFVMDSIEVKKGKVFSPVLVAFFVGALVSIGMNAVFVALYGSMAKDVDLAMSKIGVYFVSNSSNGRWDWLTLSIWLMSVFLKIIVFIYCAYKSLEKLFEFKSSKLNAYAVIFITLTLMLPMLISTDVVLSTVVAWGLIPFALLQYVLPIAMPFLVKAAQVKSGMTDLRRAIKNTARRSEKLKEATNE
ncbi:MAG: GerAB/ArcD/ProY family transporter [Firmicutes bacterium]|nr:GerAB/ArcD/ProY family transporter [Bacillota bacterium]